MVAILVPTIMLGLDQLFFQGSSLPRLRELGGEPLPYRLLILVFSAVTEEVIYRLGIATLFAWLSYIALSRRLDHAKAVSQWVGIAVAAFLFGLAHVGNLPDVAHPLLRAITLNGVAGIVLGWLYWWRGLEFAILTHFAAILVLYVVVPPLL